MYAVRNFDRILGLQGIAHPFTLKGNLRALMQLECSPGTTRRSGECFDLATIVEMIGGPPAVSAWNGLLGSFSSERHSIHRTLSETS